MSENTLNVLLFCIVRYSLAASDVADEVDDNEDPPLLILSGFSDFQFFVFSLFLAEILLCIDCVVYSHLE